VEYYFKTLRKLNFFKLFYYTYFPLLPCSLFLSLIHTENIRRTPPTPDEWWEDVDTPGTIDVYQEVDDDNLLPKVAINARVSSRHKKFHNCGFEIWMHVRAVWRIQTVETIPKKLALTERSQLVKSLRKATSQRTYELPRRMALSDLIRVYNDIWDGDDH